MYNSSTKDKTVFVAVEVVPVELVLVELVVVLVSPCHHCSQMAN